MQISMIVVHSMTINTRGVERWVESIDGSVPSVRLHERGGQRRRYMPFLRCLLVTKHRLAEKITPGQEQVHLLAKS